MEVFDSFDSAPLSSRLDSVFFAAMRRTLSRHFGSVTAQRPLMHTSACDAQQSAFVVHFSNSCAHCGTCAVHTSLPPLVGSGRQKPPQHSSPVSQSLPSCLHGSTTQYPRELPARSSCAGR